jgi:hypothetical protein
MSVRTGRAACVAAGGTLERPQVEARVDLELLGEANARRGLGRWLDELRAAGHEVTRCAVLAKKAPMPASIQAIVAAHPRIHTAEGCFYRDVLCASARESGLRAEVIAPGDLERVAADVLGVPAARQAELLARAGRTVGPPWARDQKAGALAAWVLLAM